MPQGAITTSWDDGAPQDLDLADLLKKYALPGTFYTPRCNTERTVLNESQIRQLATEFEVGAHTLHHVRLDRVSKHDAETEVRGSKEWLADVTGHDIRSFCYPGGHVTKEAACSVRESGFRFARTTHLLQTRIPNLLSAPTSLQLYPHLRLTYFRNLTRRTNLNGIARYVLSLHLQTDLMKLTELLLDEISTNGGMFHLWGHSWEIEEKGLWQMTENVMRMLADRKDLHKLTNGDLISNHLIWG